MKEIYILTINNTLFKITDEKTFNEFDVNTIKRQGYSIIDIIEDGDKIISGPFICTVHVDYANNKLTYQSDNYIKGTLTSDKIDGVYKNIIVNDSVESKLVWMKTKGVL